MNLPKEVCLYISYYIDDPKTWHAFMRVCKNAKTVCDYRKEQKQWQFQPLTLVLQIDNWGTDSFPHICETDEQLQTIEQSHDQAQNGGRILIGGSVWGDGKLAKLRMSRLELLRQIGSNPL